jgi:NADPH-dependent 2,4-dienoyl-CoA reductase/sulfur reductase-like enzyme
MMERVDVLIVGAGSAGLSAAAETTRHGLATMLVDGRSSAGGQFYARPHADPLEGLPEELLAGIDVERLELRLGTSAWGVFDNRAVGLSRPGASEVIACDALVIATGAMERPQPFPGWDMPGVIAAGGMQLLVKESGVAPIGRVIVAGTGPFLLPVAAQLRVAGADVHDFVEAMPRRRLAGLLPALLRSPDRAREGISYARALRGVRMHFGATIAAAEPGVLALSSGERLPWDVLCIGHGFVPRLDLARLAGLAIAGGAILVDDRLATSRSGVFAAGEVTGVGGAPLAAVEGRLAGLAVAECAGRWTALSEVRFRSARKTRARLLRFARSLWATYGAFPPLALATPETTLCRCEGVTLGDIQASSSFWLPEEGARAAKAMLRCGMGPCQGAMCLAAVTSAVSSRSQADWAEPRVRPPLGTVTVGEIGDTAAAL